MAVAYEAVVRAAIENVDALVRATFSKPSDERAAQWRRVVIRPVVARKVLHLQFSRFTQDKAVTKNYAPVAVARELSDLLRQGFRDIQIETTLEHIHVTVTGNGRARVRRRPRPAPAAPDPTHDQPTRPLLGDGSRMFLRRMGILSAGGTPRPGLARKHAQVNEFVRLLAQAGGDLRPAGKELVVADLGCGNALLAFAAYHYFVDVRGVPTRLFGVDLKSDLIARHRAEAEALGWDRVTFHAERIADFDPLERPDVVLALHACDTATDEALARAIAWKSQVVLSVPCCHHHLHAQLAGREAPPLFAPVFRHGILRERWADVLTDAFRALILRIMGYRTDVIEFTSPEHTTRNLMIRAVRAAMPEHRAHISDYVALRRYWNVTPRLEELLGAVFSDLVGGPAVLASPL